MKKINAQIVADSVNQQGDRITSFILTYPRFIHSELMTHRMFSRNSASSRAIPFEKMLKMVEDDCFIPIAWQRDHKGMQGTEYIDPHTDENCFPIGDWLCARDRAMDAAIEINADDVTKQLCNRLLEPFMWHTVLVTATEYNNFFELRCPKYHTPVSGEGFYFKSKKDCLANHSNPENLEKLEKFNFYNWQKINSSGAEIHIQALAECMWDARNESIPRNLKPGEWHIPFGDQMDIPNELIAHYWGVDKVPFSGEVSEVLKIMISTARCARLSYMTFEGEINYKKDIELHNTLLKSGHMSPFEHVAKCMSDGEYASFRKGEMRLEWLDKGLKGQLFASFENDYYDGITDGWCNNFRGFIPYRYLIENKKEL